MNIWWYILNKKRCCPKIIHVEQFSYSAGLDWFFFITTFLTSQHITQKSLKLEKFDEYYNEKKKWKKPIILFVLSNTFQHKPCMRELLSCTTDSSNKLKSLKLLKYCSYDKFNFWSPILIQLLMRFRFTQSWAV